MARQGWCIVVRGTVSREARRKSSNPTSLISCGTEMLMRERVLTPLLRNLGSEAVRERNRKYYKRHREQRERIPVQLS